MVPFFADCRSDLWLQVLHHLLLKLFKVEPGELLMEFLALDEQLLDIGDDLVDYEVSSAINCVYFRFYRQVVNSLVYSCAYF